MMKYIFCILLGVFLCWGSHLISNEAQEAYRLEAGSNGIQTYSYSYTSNANEVARSYSVLSNLRIMAIAFIINLPGNLLLIPGYNIGI